MYSLIPDLIRRRMPKAGDIMRVAHGPAQVASNPVN